MPIPFKAVIFDLDGTLVDTAPDLHAAVNRLLAEEGRTALGLAETTVMIGDGVAKLVERAMAASGPAAAADDIPGLAARFLGHYEGHAAELSKPFPGVEGALERVAADGATLGVCTNKPYAASMEILGDLGLADHFTAVMGGDSLDGIRKPDPRLMAAVVERLGAVPAEAVMVGDNANDVASARALGIPVVVRAGGYTATPPEKLGADGIFEHFDQLPDLLARLA